MPVLMPRCDALPDRPLLPCMPCDGCHVTQAAKRPKRVAAQKAAKAHARVALQVTQRELAAADGLSHLGLRIGVPLCLHGRSTPAVAP